MNISELKTEIEKSYKKHFPESAIVVNYGGSLYKSMSITAFLAGKKEEFHGGISHNDLFSFSFFIYADVDGFESEITLDNNKLPTALILSCSENKYTTKPTEKYMAYGAKKVSFRKTRGDAEKIVVALDRFFGRAKAQILKSLESEEIPESYIDLLTKKITK